MSKAKIILSIETSVEGGSLAVLSNNRQIADWQGKQDISKAEEVLEQISKLLQKNKTDKKQINIIAVSKGSGSVTGEKIGLALGKGLSKSIKCRLVEVSAFESLILESGEKFKGECVVALPYGKNQIQWQSFYFINEILCRTDAQPYISGKSEFNNILKSKGFVKIIFAAGCRQFYEENLDHSLKPQVNISSASLAKLNGMATAIRVR